MYYPIQLPHILETRFSHSNRYSESCDTTLDNFVICCWEITPLPSFSEATATVNNIIVTDGCIDLVVGYDEKRIGFSGMRHTVFDYTICTPMRFFGARLKPGAFHQLTNHPATDAMDAFLPLEEFDASFDAEAFFGLPYDEAKLSFRHYLRLLAQGKEPQNYVLLFDELYENPPKTTAELYDLLHFSSRQCQRLFLKYYGYSPQKALSILRFQRCLAVLTSQDAKPADLLSISHYCDQSHYSKDFRKNIGITPRELIARYT